MLKRINIIQNLRTISIGDQLSRLRGMHPGQWPFIPQVICAAIVFAMVMAGSWYLYLDSQLDELDRGVKEEEKLKEDYKTKIQQAINLDALKKQKEQVGQYVAAMEKQLPSKAEMDALLSDINQAGIGRGLQFELFKPGQVIVRDYYAELPINIKVRGSYHDVASFASDIASLPRIVTLNNMALVSAQGNALTLDTVAKTFRYLDADELAAKRKAESNKKGAKK